MKELTPVFVAVITSLGAIVAAIIEKAPTTVSFIVIIASLIFAIGWLLIMRSKTEKKRVKEIGHVKDVIDHPFFHEMLYYVEQEIPTLEIADPHKCFVAKTFLRLKFETFSDRLRTSVLDNNFKVSDHAKLLYDMQKEYHTRALDAGIPKVFIDRFEETFIPIADLMKDSILSISTSKFLVGDRAKHIAILYQYLAAFHSTIVAVESTINTMNGELEKALDKHFSKKELRAACDTEGKIRTRKAS